MSSLQTYKEIWLKDQLDNTQLLHKVIEQLDKDARLAGTSFDGNTIFSADQLLKKLYEWLYGLINKDFGTYLNFLYRADISEKTLSGIAETDPAEIVKKVTLLVLDRELSKIQFRNKNR